MVLEALKQPFVFSSTVCETSRSYSRPYLLIAVVMCQAKAPALHIGVGGLKG